MTADTDDLPLSAEDDVASTGAAADSAEANEKLKRLPRILRYAVLVRHHDAALRERLVAEIAELAPGIEQTVAWAQSDDPEIAMALAATLDRLAVTQDKSDLRSLADCVRLLSLPLRGGKAHAGDHRRVAKVLLRAMNHLPSDIDLKLAAEAETFAAGWAAMPVAVAMDPIARRHGGRASEEAYRLGRLMVQHRAAFIEAKLLAEFARERKVREEAGGKTAEEAALPAIDVPEDHVVVCRMAAAEVSNSKTREHIASFKSAINTALPLALVPPLHEVRRRLLFEFPYAGAVVDFVLADLVGRRTVRLRPLLLLGAAGSGKTRFVRRLAQTLLLECWRTDASRSDGAVFAGTERRWHTAEPCHPFLAIARANQANPIVLIDEIEKAGTRTDYGRLWDCLLGFLEMETCSRYLDPMLQVQLDLSQVSYVATANSLDPLPAPLRDRLRIIRFPTPGPEHLDALLPPVLADLAAESGLDSRGVGPLSGVERDLIAAHWRGGSVRRLRRIVEVMLRTRDKTAIRN